MNHTATTQEPEEQHGVVATLLDVLPVETLSTILRECRLPDICMFSEVSKFANSIAGDNALWKPLFEMRRWNGGSALSPENPHSAGAWREAYRRAARAESPLVIHLTELRMLMGWAKDRRPLAVGRESQKLDAVGDIIDTALAELGLADRNDASRASAAAAAATDAPGPPLRGMDVIVVVNVLDGTPHVNALMAHLFARGAKRARLVDAAVCALQHAGCRTGTVLFLDLEHVTAACVADGVRIAPRTVPQVSIGLRASIEHFVRAHCSASATGESGSASSANGNESTHSTSDQHATWSRGAINAMGGVGGRHRLSGAAPAAASSPLTAGAAAAADVSWLLRTHCYVRAVSVDRRPVGGDERTMASCNVSAPSGVRWALAEERFMSYEQLFRAPPPPPSQPASAAPSAAAPPAASPGATSLPATSASPPVAGSGLAAALVLASSPRRLPPTGAQPAASPWAHVGGAMEVLTRTIDASAGQGQQTLGDLYGAVLLSGSGGSVPGLRQRMESELRSIRSGSGQSVPRALRPRLVELAGSAVERDLVQMMASSPVGTPEQAGGAAIEAVAQWSLSEGEIAPWCGAAGAACAYLARARHAACRPGGPAPQSGLRTASALDTATTAAAVGPEPTWTTTEQFARESKVATRAAMRAGGCVIERWAPGATSATPAGASSRGDGNRRAGGIGGAWGGSGLERGPGSLWPGATG